VALRVVEVILPQAEADIMRDLVEVHARGGPWQQPLDGGLVCVRLLFEAEDSGAFVDEMQRRFCNVKGFHLLISPVSAALPRPKADAKPPRRFGSRGGGLTREELYDEGLSMAKPGNVFYATVLLSTIVVAIGLLKGNAAVIIGAMVIAPLLGPNVALALATTLADGALIRRSLRSNATGIALALGVTVVLGFFFRHVAFSEEIASRAEPPDISDVLLALAAGSAGALALTTGMASALVGVMVAVALLPPTAVVGLTLGRGAFQAAGHATLLLAVNLIAVNLAATTTFLVQGIRPRTWWQADRARRATIISLMIGGLLLVALLALTFLA